MANTTDPLAFRAHGVDPQSLIEKITREKIYDSRYWKERCFALTAETLLERAVEDIKAVGGVVGGLRRPTLFLSLVLKMLQLGPEREVVLDCFVRQADFKYVRVLGAFYWRLVGHPPAEVYRELEPLLSDYRKIKVQVSENKYELSYVDELVDQLLTREDFADTKLPRLTARHVLVETGDLAGERESMLRDELDNEDAAVEENGDAETGAGNRPSEGSVEYWNDMRAKLGLKPLKE